MGSQIVDSGMVRQGKASQRPELRRVVEAEKARLKAAGGKQAAGQASKR